MEKEQYLSKLCANVNLKITPMHSLSDQQWTPNTDLAICTIEKANALVNKFIEEKTYFDIELFVIDELHLLLDDQRGFLLECLISKLMAIQKIQRQATSENSARSSFQFIGMSATMSGKEKLERWLNMKVFEC